MKFVKMHGLGNDFVIVNGFSEKMDETDYPSLARKVCDRNFGIGADGLVFILPSDIADIKMRIFNSDGSEAEMCGNVIRCCAKYVYEEKIVSKPKIRVETLAGIRIPELIFSGDEITGVRVDMGEPQLDRSKIPMVGPEGQVISEPLKVDNQEFAITAVSMGNPHCIIFVDNLAQFPYRDLGPKIETHPSFPKKINVEFVEVISENEVKMRVWERGAGETLACGTGACATTVACVLNKKTGRRVTVHLAGGDLLIEWGEDNHVYMTGPAVKVFSGEYFLK